MNLSVIIPVFNSANVLEKNLPKVLEAVKDYHDGKIEIILTDDNSSDNSTKVIGDFIKKYKSDAIDIKLLMSDENQGFSSNVNRGAQAAKGESLILLNADVIPSKNFLDPLLSHFMDESLFAVGCMDESVENGKIVLRGRGLGRWKKGFLVHSKGSIDKTNTLWVSGGSSAFRRSIWEELGGLDGLYNPFYWEDIDLSYRALKSGYKLAFDKNSVVRHEHEKGVIKREFSSNEIKKIAYRNQFIFVWKNADLTNLLIHIFFLPYHLITSIASKDYLLSVGFLNALIRLPKIIKSRSKSSKRFVLSDKKIIADFTS